VTDKTSAKESQHIDSLRNASPFMAALTSVGAEYYELQESDALWAELDSLS
jgi:hypothetical protein